MYLYHSKTIYVYYMVYDDVISTVKYSPSTIVLCSYCILLFDFLAIRQN